jgi:hypothetical protein
MDRIENDASNTFSIVVCEFVAAVTFLSEPLPSNDSGIHVKTQTDERNL